MAGGPVIIGAGLAGLVTALRLAPQPCLVLTTGTLGTCASSWAQGGIAAALGADDSPALHAADTLAAGAGLCDPKVVSAVTAAAPEAVAWLASLSARFDRHPDGSYRLGLEGAHSRHRIVHAAGDGSGAEIMRAVVEAVRRTRSITVLEHTRARRLVQTDGVVSGVVVEHAGHQQTIRADQVVLATGGAGGLWWHTTNPSGAQGQGLVLAARAGAELRDLEMVQFHPTALDVGLDPMPLVSEAVRGEGAVLVDTRGGRLVADDLASRDVVARAVWAELGAGGRVFLDARSAIGARFASAFPAVHRACASAGIDPATDLIPVRPAAHYHCGGVVVDPDGRTTVPGLWAVGEVASTGLHGANRLASNSLLEAVVCGSWTAAALPHPTGRASVPPPDPTGRATVPPSGPTGRATVPPSGTDALRTLMSEAAGVLRDGPTLGAAATALRDQVQQAGVDHTDDASLAALLICHSALQRTESRGGHLRMDAAQTATRQADARQTQHPRHTTVRLADVLTPTRELVLTGGAG